MEKLVFFSVPKWNPGGNRYCLLYLLFLLIYLLCLLCLLCLLYLWYLFCHSLPLPYRLPEPLRYRRASARTKPSLKFRSRPVIWLTKRWIVGGVSLDIIGYSVLWLVLEDGLFFVMACYGRWVVIIPHLPPPPSTRLVISTFTPIVFIEISLCFQPTDLIWVFFLLHKLTNFTPPPQSFWAALRKRR